MGGIGRKLFGGPEKSSSSSKSGNLAYNNISSTFSPSMGYTAQGGDMVASLLGLGGGEAQTEGLERFADSAGMDFMMEQGNRMIDSNQSAKGLLKSGSTLKALTKYGQGLGKTYLTEYMDNLFNLSNLGLGAGSLVSDAGRYSESQSKSEGKKKGIISSLAKAVGAVA